MPAVREKLLPVSLVVLVANVAALAWLLAQPLPLETGSIAVSNPANPAAMPDLSSLEEVDAGRQGRFEARLEAWRLEQDAEESP